MSDPISFDPFLGWVDTTDPDNIPEEVRIIGAADLLRYENFGVAATTAVNELITTTEDTNLALGDIDDRLVIVEGASPTAVGFVKKPSSTTRTDTTTLTADPGLTLAIPSLATVEVEAVIFLTTPTAADIKLGFGGTGLQQAYYEVDGGMVYGSTTGSVTIAGTGLQQAVVMRGLVTFNSGSSNVLDVMWAQATSDAGNTIVHHSSYMKTYVVP